MDITEKMMIKPINIVCPINQLGYGVTSLNIVKKLSTIRNTSLWCIGNPQVTNQEDANIISQCLKNSQFLDFNAPCIKIWHQHDMTQFAGKGKRIGFPIFELDEFSTLEKHHLNSLDSLFVCSEWAKNVALNNLNISKENIHVIPLGVDLSIFRPKEVNNTGKTIFFNCGKWEIRKGHDIIPEIFTKAFDEKDDVELWMMCQNPFLTENDETLWRNLFLKSKLGNKIKFINRVNTQEEVYNIMSQTDCGLFPARAEGWNLELLEMMACGKHVIATNYAAHTEFCNKDNCYLINIDTIETAYDGQWFHGTHGKWATLNKNQIDQAIEHCRTIHSLKQSGNLQKNTFGISTSNHFTWDNSVENILHYV
ncbi:glycosyltransferase [bacterium]|nr:glycosyltransferase [bacterium]